MRPGEEKLVFNRFWRSDPSRVRRSGGTGLGLAISVEDANLHNGKLEAWGEPGRGASFRLTLPRVRGRKAGRSPLPLVPTAAHAVQGKPPPMVPEAEKDGVVENPAVPGHTGTNASAGTNVSAGSNDSAGTNEPAPSEGAAT